MIFNEIYSAYYNAVAAILAALTAGPVDEKTIDAIVRRYAFGESMLTVWPSLKKQKWQLVRADRTTPIAHKPAMPLTLLQKQWLKAVSLDPRLQLFGVQPAGLDDTEPLFTPDDYTVYDKYADGDPYEDEGYIARFRTILAALREKKALKIKARTRKGDSMAMVLLPVRLEYSEKDDKFRLIGTGCRYGTVNLARITDCELCPADGLRPGRPAAPVRATVTLRIRDERNALERCMLHFAHFEKQAERAGDGAYLVRIRYDKDDETEMEIRILSFGPMVEVLGPDDFRGRITERLKRQKSCGLV